MSESFGQLSFRLFQPHRATKVNSDSTLRDNSCKLDWLDDDYVCRKSEVVSELGIVGLLGQVFVRVTCLR
jgi:hypothetical protein